jgi:hypothetical protein
VRLLAVTVALLTTPLLAGCGLHRVPDSSFLDLHVKNNTRPTVTLLIPGKRGNQRLYNGEGVYWSAWRNDKPGIALVRVVSGGKTLGCLKVHTAKASDTRPCWFRTRSPAHDPPFRESLLVVGAQASFLNTGPVERGPLEVAAS